MLVVEVMDDRLVSLVPRTKRRPSGKVILAEALSEQHLNGHMTSRCYLRFMECPVARAGG